MKEKITSFLRIYSNLPKILVITIVLYYYKNAFWPLTYLFVISYTVLVGLFLLRFDWKFRFSDFFNGFMTPIVLLGIFILAVLLNGHFSNAMVKKDILLISVLFSLFYFLYWNDTFMQGKIPKSFALNLIILITTFISVLNLIRVIFPSLIPSELFSKLNLSEGMVLAYDYNIFCLFILFGLVILNYRNDNSILRNRYSKIITNLISSIYLINVVLSGSRRGIIVLLTLIFIYLINNLVKKRWKFGLHENTRGFVGFIAAVVLFFSIVTIIFQKIPKEKITYAILRYSSLVGINNYNYLNFLLWYPKNKISTLTGKYYNNSTSKLNPKYWRSSDKLADLKNVKTPFGDGIKIVWKNSTKEDLYLYYNGPEIVYLANHSYKISFKTKFSKGDINSLNVGWFVDDGGRGYSKTVSIEKETESIGADWYNFTSNYTFIDNQIETVLFIDPIKDQSEFIISDIEITDLNYDSNLPSFPNKITSNEELYLWLDKINPPVMNDLNLINNGDFMNGLGFWQSNADSLKIKIAGNKGKRYAIISRGNGDGVNWSLYYVGRNIELKANNEYQISFKLKPVFPKTVPFFVGYWVNEGEGYKHNLKLKIDSLNDGWLNIKAKYTFKNNQSNIGFPINTQISNSQFYITDISLINLTQPQFQIRPYFQVANIKKERTLFFDRTYRWQYAVELWKTEYKWYNKLFGHGFDYYEWFGKKFLNDPIRGDYPHNPFISILLYSGIVGLAFYFWLLYRVFFLYIFYRKEYGVLFICFLITFFFSFFSGSSPFDPPIMGFFVILPFFIHSVHEREKKILLKTSS